MTRARDIGALHRILECRYMYLEFNPQYEYFFVLFWSLDSPLRVTMLFFSSHSFPHPGHLQRSAALSAAGSCGRRVLAEDAIETLHAKLNRLAIRALTIRDKIKRATKEFHLVEDSQIPGAIVAAKTHKKKRRRSGGAGP